MLLDQEKRKLVVKATKVRRQVEANEQLHVSMTIVHKVLETNQGILGGDVYLTDTICHAIESNPSFRRSSTTCVCVPLVSRQLGPLGVMQLMSKNAGSKFQEADLELLVELAIPISLSLENSYLGHRLDFESRTDA